MINEFSEGAYKVEVISIPCRLSSYAPTGDKHLKILGTSPDLTTAEDFFLTLVHFVLGAFSLSLGLRCCLTRKDNRDGRFKEKSKMP